MADLSLLIRRRIAAPVERVFAAWTRPELLVRWWGPVGVRCTEAQVDLRVGGAYAIANETPDGTVWIRGTFLEIDEPRRLVYTWVVGDAPPDGQRVTVRFDGGDGHTDVVVVHQHIEDPAARDGHEAGWIGCLDGLVRMFDPA